MNGNLENNDILKSSLYFSKKIFSEILIIFMIKDYDKGMKKTKSLGFVF